jgi:hypothetical protein
MRSAGFAGILVLSGAACSSAHGGGNPAFDVSDAGWDGPGNAPPASSPDDSGPPSSPGDDGAAPFVAFEGGTGSATCRPGQYVGTYTGVNDSSKVGGPTNFPISGPIALTLTLASMNGEDFLAINGGTFDLSWGQTTGDASSGLIVVHATLTGNLNCANGTFAASDPAAPWTTLGLPTGNAMVNFNGTYAAGTATISGPFTAVSALATSTGTWSVTLAP